MRTCFAALAVFALLTTASVFANPTPSPSAPAVVASGVPVAVVSPAPVVAAPAAEVSPVDFLGQVTAVIQKFGGASTMLKISLAIMLLVSSMKVTIINQLIWAKLGVVQAWIAPLLGLVAGVLDLAGSGQLTLASLVAYMSAGAGAIILHELLDSVKAIPGLGSMWVSLIELIEKNLGGPAATKTVSTK